MPGRSQGHDALGIAVERCCQNVQPAAKRIIRYVGGAIRYRLAERHDHIGPAVNSAHMGNSRGICRAQRADVVSEVGKPVRGHFVVADLIGMQPIGKVVRGQGAAQIIKIDLAAQGLLVAGNHWHEGIERGLNFHILRL